MSIYIVQYEKKKNYQNCKNSVKVITNLFAVIEFRHFNTTFLSIYLFLEYLFYYWLIFLSIKQKKIHINEK